MLLIFDQKGDNYIGTKLKWRFDVCVPYILYINGLGMEPRFGVKKDGSDIGCVQ